ncbi:MAG: hypothetical protein ACOYK9_02515 [Chlamydiia bacterium]
MKISIRSKAFSKTVHVAASALKKGRNKYFGNLWMKEPHRVILLYYGKVFLLFVISGITIAKINLISKASLPISMLIILSGAGVGFRHAIYKYRKLQVEIESLHNLNSQLMKKSEANKGRYEGDRISLNKQLMGWQDAFIRLERSIKQSVHEQGEVWRELNAHLVVEKERLFKENMRAGREISQIRRVNVLLKASNEKLSESNRDLLARLAKCSKENLALRAQVEYHQERKMVTAEVLRLECGSIAHRVS